MLKCRSFTIAIGLFLAMPLIGLAQDPSAKITAVRQEHNVARAGQRGLLISMDCQVSGLRDNEVLFAAFFYQGDALVPAKLGMFRTPDGGATAQAMNVPKFEVTDFTNVELFLPYDVIDLPPGRTYKLRFFVELQYRVNGKDFNLATSADQFFDLNTGAAPGGGQLDGRWFGSEDLQGYGDLMFAFSPNGVCLMTDKDGEHDGTWARTGNDVTLTFSGGAVVYRGVVAGRVIAGAATGRSGTWNWRVSQSRGGGGPALRPKDGPLAEPGLYVSRWALSHGRWDGARAVGVLTDDNPKGRPIPTVRALVSLIKMQPNPMAIDLDLDPTGRRPADPRRPSALVLAAAALPSGMTLLVYNDLDPAGWNLKHWDQALPRFGKGNYYATVSVPDKKIFAGMELSTPQHFLAYKANSILWEAPDFGDIVVHSQLAGGTLNLGLSAAVGKKTKHIARSVGYADPFELNLREVNQTVAKDGRIHLLLEATLPASFDPVRILRWSAETKKGTLFGDVALPA